VASAPEGIVLRRHRDLEGRRYGIWIRRALLALVAAISLLGLLNVFGQRPESTSVDAPAAKLTLYAPNHLRGGILYSARFHVVAHRDLKQATLVLDPGWAEGMSINTIEPSPAAEASSNGKLSLQLGKIVAGDSHILFMQFQVNPTNVAWQRPQDVRLYDGRDLLLTMRRSVTIFP
jgi:hypothetical protein